MVNGPRPASIAAPPSQLGSVPASVTPARSPLHLQRQTTSIYSTCTSTGTPMLVYGKAATPIAGAWSAEPVPMSAFQPTRFEEELEQPEQPEGGHESHLENTHHDDDGASSVAETAAFTDKASTARSHYHHHHDHQDQHHHVDDGHGTAPAAVETDPAAPTLAAQYHLMCQQQQQPTAIGAVADADFDKQSCCSHVTVVYRHDPYSIFCRREMYRCECTACLDGATIGCDRLASGSYAHFSTTAFGAMGGNDDPMSFADGNMSSPAMSYGGYDAPEYVSGDAPWLLGQEDHQQRSAAETQQTVMFIPPPPPPKIARGVIAESAEPSLDADAAFYHIAMRWYGKVAAAQGHFLQDQADHCPEPAPEMHFDEWIQAAGAWWLKHFEHAQVKTSPSSSMLRTPATQAHTRPAGAAFETHASISAGYAQHRHALRAGPRKTRGTSGLTASMLETLGSRPAIPAPRSKNTAKRPGDADEDKMPW